MMELCLYRLIPAEVVVFHASCPQTVNFKAPHIDVFGKLLFCFDTFSIYAEGVVIDWKRLRAEKSLVIKEMKECIKYQVIFQAKRKENGEKKE